MKIVFLGSPDLGLPCLRALHDAPDMDLGLVLTLPDARRGRRGSSVPTAVGQGALDLGIPLMRWGRGDRPAVEEALRAERPDAVVVIAFARLLRPSFLEIPRLGCLNLHASLLPWGRGASPIQQAVLEGLPETGWSAMHMDEGLDTGAVLARSPLRLDPSWNSGMLYEVLRERAPGFLLETLRAWDRGELVPEPQDESLATHTRKIPRNAGSLDWSLSAGQLHRRILAYTPVPGCWCRWREGRLRVLEAEPAAGDGKPGRVLDSPPDRLRVACGEGALDLLRLQAEGTRPLAAADFLRGRPLPAGSVLEKG